MYRAIPAAFLLLVVAVSTSAFASGYDYFSRGVDANNRDESDTAITSFTEAIASGDLAQAYLPVAYLGRARAYMKREQCLSAASDLTAAIKLKPDYLDAYVLRSGANACLNRPVEALVDISAAIRLKPTAELYFSRARQQWAMGSYSRAAADAAEATKIDPRDPYIMLWIGILDERVGAFDQDEFSRRVSDLTIRSWPAPLLDLYRGIARPDDVYRAARHAGDATDANNRKCEADFYIGEWLLLRRNTAAAKPLLKTATEECPRNFIAYAAAKQEFGRVQ